MKFELTEKVTTTAPPAALIEELAQQFTKSAKNVERVGEGLRVTTIIDTFGAINRNDTTTVSVRPVPGGQMVVAEVDYKPSLYFWILLLILLFTAFGWIFPVAFFFYNKTVVEKSIQATLQRVRNQFSIEGGAAAAPASDVADQLEKLASLKERGLLTEQEFNDRKAKLLQS